MQKFCSLKIPDFEFEKIIDHPSYPGLKIRFYAIPEDNKETYPESEEVADLIIDRISNGNLAGWFRAGITVFCDMEDIDPEELVLANCTHESFDDFMEDEIFNSVVLELTQDMFEFNKNDPMFLAMFTPTSKMLS